MTTDDFIREIVKEDLRTNKNSGRVVTRFPPEPNGYLHIGHAKSICLNFGIALEFDGGRCHLRFDDTNPSTEDIEYTDSIKDDVRWLGFDWHEHLYFASDYFEELYNCAVDLIKQGKAYVCNLSLEETAKYRGTLTEPGKNSPCRDRPIEENLDLLERMRNREFKEGEYVLKAKIDMAHPNLNMRDPVLYRIRYQSHHRTGNKWCIYPTYDFTHGQSDAIECVTHSLCTLEFENHRPLYDWFLDNLHFKCRPRQIEFARLNLNYTVMSKRKLLELVQGKYITGWDDPRLPTLRAIRRRGYTPEAIRDFCDRISVAKKENWIDMSLLESCVRDDLNQKAPRVMCVLRPLRVILTNYPEGETEEIEAPYYPDDPPRMGTHMIPFTRELYIEESDFMEDPPKKFFRLAPGREVRLRWGYIIKCEKVIKDETTGSVTALECTYDPDTRSGPPKDGRKVKGTIHWVSAPHSISVEVRLYDRLFTVERPEGPEFKNYLNPNSLEIIKDAWAERSLAESEPDSKYQFERTGYFCVDTVDSTPDRKVFNRIVSLRDSWSKMTKENKN